MCRIRKRFIVDPKYQQWLKPINLVILAQSTLAHSGCQQRIDDHLLFHENGNPLISAIVCMCARAMFDPLLSLLLGNELRRAE